MNHSNNSFLCRSFRLVCGALFLVILGLLSTTAWAENVDYLIVGGGGGGGSGTASGGGGGGSVEYLTAQNLGVGTYAVVVGAGGAADAKGGNSSFNGTTAYGGGYGAGGDGNSAAGTGGSGGGGHVNLGGANAGSGSNVYRGGGGDNGGTSWSGGGGGGAGGNTQNPAQAGGTYNGGNGLANSITGSSIYYAGGGGGGYGTRTGGLGGGGNGGLADANGSSGAANKGGGGGGSGKSGAGTGGAGGSGVVIIRYAGTQHATGGTVTTSGGYTIHTFNSSGNFVLSAPAPVISSALTASATQSQATSYTITASQSPTSFGATSLPAGLSVNTANGVISGTPTTAGTFTSTISATNASGTGNATLTWTIASGAPTITSATTATATKGQSTSYTIIATNSPTSFAATSLPAGVSLNTATGVISGTPTTAGTVASTLTATNSIGTSANHTLTWTIVGPLVVVTPSDTSVAVVNGNMGLGTSSPMAKIDVAVPSAGNVNDGIVVERASGATVFGFKLKSDGTGNFRGALTVKGNGGSETESMSFGADVYAGNVGIGAILPSFPLSFGTNLGNKVALYDAGGGNGYGFGIQDSILQIFANTAADRVGVGHGNSGAFVETLTVKNGKVGIGITSPTHALTVNGTIRAKEVIVDTGWADFVFEENYPLMPLAEVEKYIQAEKHLPGVPSSTQVAAGGVSLGEMQAKLLEKVEELTLHLIAQEKRIQKLEVENAALRATSNAR